MTSAWAERERSAHLPGRQSGSAMVEYSVVSLITVLTLFVPLPGLDESLLNTLLTAFREFQANTTFLLSLP